MKVDQENWGCRVGQRGCMFLSVRPANLCVFTEEHHQESYFISESIFLFGATCAVIHSTDMVGCINGRQISWSFLFAICIKNRPHADQRLWARTGESVYCLCELPAGHQCSDICPANSTVLDSNFRLRRPFSYRCSLKSKWLSKRSIILFRRVHPDSVRCCGDVW
jgi:hypothetical protein